LANDMTKKLYSYIIQKSREEFQIQGKKDLEEAINASVKEDKP